MEKYDPQLAERVWQRVQGTVPTGPDVRQLLMMITEEWADAATYLHLSRRLQGRHRDTLQRLFREEQAHTACLKGIYALVTGNQPVIRPPKPTQEPVSVTLRRCYGREMRALSQYEANAADPEYGQVFARLAAQEREHCKTVLELLGSLR